MIHRLQDSHMTLEEYSDAKHISMRQARRLFLSGEIKGAWPGEGLDVWIDPNMYQVPLPSPQPQYVTLRAYAADVGKGICVARQRRKELPMVTVAGQEMVDVKALTTQREAARAAAYEQHKLLLSIPFHFDGVPQGDGREYDWVGDDCYGYTSEEVQWT